MAIPSDRRRTVSDHRAPLGALMIIGVVAWGNATGIPSATAQSQHRPTHAAASSEPVTPTTNEKAAPVNRDALTLCMDTWPARTHISRSMWRETCKRAASEHLAVSPSPF